jgi:sugar/nucleoside kinase (ribokinase family)
VRGHPGLIVQTNVDDDAAAGAPQLARTLQAATSAAGVIVTAGAAGVVALTGSRQFVVPAFRVAARHTHCAGAAFSGGLVYGLLHDWPMEDSLTLASASGALRCERAHHEPMPTFDEVNAFIGTRERVAARAA